MSKRNYRAKRTDTNHAEIRDAMRALGWLVLDTHDVANFVDLVAWHPPTGALRLVEVKTSKGRVSISQQKLRDDGWPVHIVRSVEDAISL